MINIIGVGEMGCKLATEFAKSEHYDVYKIGIDLPKLYLLLIFVDRIFR